MLVCLSSQIRYRTVSNNNLSMLLVWQSPRSVNFSCWFTRDGTTRRPWNSDAVTVGNHWPQNNTDNGTIQHRKPPQDDHSHLTDTTRQFIAASNARNHPSHTREHHNITVSKTTYTASVLLDVKLHPLNNQSNRQHSKYSSKH